MRTRFPEAEMIGLSLHAAWRRVSSLPVRWHPSRRLSRSCSLFLLVSLCGYTAPLAVQAQDTTAISTNTYTAVPSYEFVETNQPPPRTPLPTAEPLPSPNLAGTSQLAPPSTVPLSPVPPLLRWGPLTAQTHVSYRLSYGDGLQASPGQQSKIVMNQVSPGIRLSWGGHWALDYTPVLTFYSSSAFRDTFDNAVTLTGQTAYGDWTFGLLQAYASSSDPIIETASQLDQESYSTGLTATRQLGSQTSLELGANQSFRFLDSTVPGEPLSDSRSWSTMDWLNYQFWSRFSVGVGLGFGYDNLAVGPDMTSEQFQGRIIWVVVKKLSFVLSGGGEDRQFLGSGAPDLISPIFSLSAQYSPFEVTTLSVSASRTISPSFFQDQVTESTSMGAALHQRLLGKLFLDLSGGYGTSTYHAGTTGPAVANVSNYDTASLSVALSTTLFTRVSASVFFTQNYITSGSAAYNYTTTQTGLTLGYQF